MAHPRRPAAERHHNEFDIMNSWDSMKAVEFESTVAPGGQIALPPEIASEIPAGEHGPSRDPGPILGEAMQNVCFAKSECLDWDATRLNLYKSFSLYLHVPHAPGRGGFRFDVSRSSPA